MATPALLLIDLQRDYFDPASGVGSVEKAFCLPGVRRLLAHARKDGWLVVHVATRHETAATLPLPLRERGGRLYAKSGTLGAEFVVGLVAREEQTVAKQAYSAYSIPEMGGILQERRDVVLAGIATDCCVLHTAFDAATNHEKRVWIPLEATSASDERQYAASLRTVEKSLGVVLHVDDLLQHTPDEWMNQALQGEELGLAATTFFSGATAAYAGLQKDFADAVRAMGFEAALQRLEQVIQGS